MQLKCRNTNILTHVCLHEIVKWRSYMAHLRNRWPLVTSRLSIPKNAQYQYVPQLFWYLLDCLAHVPLEVYVLHYLDCHYKNNTDNVQFRPSEVASKHNRIATTGTSAVIKTSSCEPFRLEMSLEFFQSLAYTPRIHGTGIFAYIWLIFMANVGKYTIHVSYGYPNITIYFYTFFVPKWASYN